MAKDNRPYKIPRPKDLEEYILDHCQETYYLFFSKKRGRMYCTYCREELPIEPNYVLEHLGKKDRGVRGWCPNCGREVVTKDMRYGRKMLTDFGRNTWTRAYGAVTFIETDRFTIDYMDVKPRVRIIPDQQIKLSQKVQERWDFYDGWWSPADGEWNAIKKIGLKAQPTSVWGYTMYHDHLYYPMKFGTDLQYANDDIFRFDTYEWFDEHMAIRRLVTYLSRFLKYPAIEILEKSGFENIVLEQADGIKSRAINLRAKDLRKILKADGSEVRQMRQLEDLNTEYLHHRMVIKKMAPWAKLEDINILWRIAGGVIETGRMELIRAHADLSKLLSKLLTEYRKTGDMTTLSDYGDYLEAVNILGWRIDKRTIYPKNFTEAHDIATTERAEVQEKVNQEVFRRSQMAITGMTEPFASCGLMIRPARNEQELRNESAKLSHCVRTYADRICRGTCAILFIRQAEKPNTPYFTLELSPSGKVVQCRGLKNCGYPEEVRIFIEEWLAWMKERKREAE